MAAAECWRKLLSLTVGLGLACVPALLSAGERSPARRDAATPADEVVEMFSGIEKRQIEVQVIPKDSTQCNVLIKNKTDKPLSIRLPEAFAAMPVQAQVGLNMGGPQPAFGNRNRRGTGTSTGTNTGTASNQGGMSQMLGGGMLRGGNGGMPMNGGGTNGVLGNMRRNMGGGNAFNIGNGLFNVPPEKVGQLKVATVCLEHGKPDPRPSMKYEIRPIEEATNKPAVAEVCRMLGRGELDQRVAQVAAWHLNNDMSWEKLTNMRFKYANGMTKPYFAPEEVRAAMKVVTDITVAAGQPKPKADSALASQNRSNR